MGSEMCIRDRPGPSYVGNVSLFPLFFVVLLFKKKRKIRGKRCSVITPLTCTTGGGTGYHPVDPTELRLICFPSITQVLPVYSILRVYSGGSTVLCTASIESVAVPTAETLRVVAVCAQISASTGITCGIGPRST